MKRFTKILISFLTLLFCLSLGSLQAKTFEGTINVNTANVNELMQLPGIGKVKAENIVEMRKEKPFSSLEDLKKVKGIGDKRLESLKPYVSFSSSTNTQAPTNTTQEKSTESVSTQN
ncbi:MAG: helix-hairpin-helix domain-containing protein [Deltaproteobacteria bacterium]|nr:helix-hairpin-helix domain-containing protein [Deltaproteobacteria bacterium]